MKSNKSSGRKASVQSKAPEPRKSRSRSRSQRSQNANSKTAAPVAFSAKSSGLNQRNLQSRRIQNEEYIEMINGSTSFAVFDTLVINPGLQQYFPWLSVQALDWQQYVFHRCSVRFVTQTSTSATGSLTIAPSYNFLQPVPENLTEALNTASAVNNVCWEALDCKLDKQLMFPIGPRKLLRFGAASGDLNTYDAARVFICTNGQANTNAIGLLVISYDVEFFGPQYGPNAQLTPLYYSVFGFSSYQTIPDTTPTNLLFPVSLFDPLTVGPPASGVFTPGHGVWRIFCSCNILNADSVNWSVALQMMKNGSIQTQWGAFVDNINPPVTTVVGISAISLSFWAVFGSNSTDQFSFCVTSTEYGDTPSAVSASGTLVSWELA